MRLRLMLLASALVSSALIARADTTTYNINFTANGVSSSGTLALTSTSTFDLYQVTGISGSFSSSAAGSGTITGLMPASYDPNNPSQSVNFIYDNVASLGAEIATCDGTTTKGQVDHCGIDFLVNIGGATPLEVNLFNTANGLVVSDALLGSGNYLDSYNPVTSLTESVATTPEPSSFALLGTGILGVIGAAKRRFAE